ncbi:MAG: glycosyltransferase [Candidatus Bathyarchaeia archaeon]|jgi:glycosyltransferase involved in cell wall biosynthesis
MTNDFTRRFVLWIGGIWSVKNPLQVIDIARQLPELDFVVIGPSKDRALLEEFMRRKTANVRYLGAITGEAKTDLIRNCSAGLSTSLRETFGWVPFEFLNEGKPIICPPLDSFRELYGALPDYATTTADFVNQLKRLRKNGFRTSVDAKALKKFREKYSLVKAADSIIRKLSSRSITILARDTDPVSDYVTGFLLVDWQLWRNIHDRGIELRIISNGSKFAIHFGLTKQTSVIPRIALLLKDKAEKLEGATRMSTILVRKSLRLIIYVIEPMSYVHTLIRQRAISKIILADGYAQIAAAILAKMFFRTKVVCLLHDDAFYRDIWDANSPLVWRIFSAALTWSLIRYADRIIVVSDTLRREILHFYPHSEKISLLWS